MTVESRDATTVETEALGAKVIELYGSLKHDRRQLPAKLDRYLSELRDLEMLADLMASTFVNDPLRRQRLLEERSLNQRLRFLIRYLRDEIGNACRVEQNGVLRVLRRTPISISQHSITPLRPSRRIRAYSSIT